MEVHLVSAKISSPISLNYEENAQKEFVLRGYFAISELTKAQLQYLFKLLLAHHTYPQDGKFGLLSDSGQMEYLFKAYADFKNAKEALKVAKGKDSQSKIALFCGLYKDIMGVQYRYQERFEAGFLDKAPFEPELIKLYLNLDPAKYWWAKVKSIQYYTKNYNNLKVIEKGVGSFPDKYVPSFEKALTTEERNEYLAHIRSLGWKAHKNATGYVIGWKNEKTGEFVNK